MRFDFLADIRPFTRTVLLAATALLLYSLLCRWGGIRFFWESRAAGWTLLLLGGILGLLNRIDARGARRQNALPEKIIVGVLCFFFLLRGLIWGLFAQSDAFAATRRALAASEDLRRQIGAVQGVSVRPLGNLTTYTSDQGQQGDAELYVTAKGQHGFQDLRVVLAKEANDSAWVLRSVSPD